MRAERFAGGQPITDAEKVLRDAALSIWLDMGKADPVSTLRHLDAGRRYLERAMGREVVRLRRQGHTWAEIGDALNMTRSAAQQRYSDVAPKVRPKKKPASHVPAVKLENS